MKHKIYTGADVKSVGIHTYYDKEKMIFFILKDGHKVFLENTEDLLPFIIYGHNYEFIIKRKKTRYYVRETE